jgi:hypothetical protein
MSVAVKWSLEKMRNRGKLENMVREIKKEREREKQRDRERKKERKRKS